MAAERIIRMILRRFLNRGLTAAAKKMGGGAASERTKQARRALRVGRRIGRM